jgi:hypothetical protein
MHIHSKILIAIACSLVAACNLIGDDDGPKCEPRSGVENPCLTYGVIEKVDAVKVESVDLLFVIDNSGDDLREAQERLGAELPRMIRILTSGDRNPDDGIEPNRDFTAARDLHLAVVSTDMGLPGVQKNIDPENRCEIGPGDDGKFQNQGNQASNPNLACQPTYPPFLSFEQGRDDPDAVASELRCISALGIGGCGFEMPLEAALKALWPASPANLDQGQADLGLEFLADAQPHGDQEHIEFLRGTAYHPTQSDRLSVLAIVLLTDEDDCSAGARGNLDFLEHPNTAPPGIGEQPNALRCYYDTVNDQGYKYPVERYVNAFKALRPGYEQLVVFAAIAGIPPETDDFDFDTDGDGRVDQIERDAYYEMLFSDPLMQERIRADGIFLERSCTLPTPNADPNDPNPMEFYLVGYPPRRIAEVARGFGDNGVIRSICQDSFASAVDDIIRLISRQLGGVCLQNELERDAKGMVACDVVWQMPAGRGCDMPFLRAPAADRPQQKNGRNLCVVSQVQVANRNANDLADALEPGMEGWYYDDFSRERLGFCRGDTTDIQRIAFLYASPTTGEQMTEPPAGVAVELQCLNQLYGMLGEQEPSAVLWGNECYYDEDCGADGLLKCHAIARTCTWPCAEDADCPAEWICDTRHEVIDPRINPNSPGFPVCVNPICDSPQGEARNCGRSDLGEPCQPRFLPDDGFQEELAYVETNSPDCETRICGVFRFQGDPRTEDPSVLQDRVYCTCRCEADDESVSTCKCRDDFECLPVMELGGPGVEGSYCVRRGVW